MRKVILIAVAACLCATPAFGYDLEQKQFDLAVTAGVLGSGNIEASWYDDFRPAATVSFYNDTSLLTRVLADYYVTPYLAIGSALNYGAIIPQADIVYQDHGLHTINKHDINLLGYCVAIKGRLIVTETLAIKPGLYIGGWSSFSSTPEARESGLAINGSLEVQLFFYENYYMLFDTGFLSQPYGGIQGIAYVRGGPFYYFSVGLGL